MRARVDIEFAVKPKHHEKTHSFYMDISSDLEDEDDIIVAARDELEAIFGRAMSIYDFKVLNLDSIAELIA